MEFNIRIAQSEDGYWRYKITQDMTWIGGFISYQTAYEAAVIELKKKVSALT